MSKSKKVLSPEKNRILQQTLRERFETNRGHHKDISWNEVVERLNANPSKVWSLNQMELTGGEPDVVGKDEETGEIIFFDCSMESPKGRRKVCYDREALESRKKDKPENSAMEMAEEMGVELLTDEEYKFLQHFGPFDTATSSWLKTPADVRELGGAIFGDHRFGRTFIYHNRVDSYYRFRGFRTSLKI